MMIKQIHEAELGACAEVIKSSFMTVAEELNITEKNSPGYVAFSTTKEKLKNRIQSGGQIYAYIKENKILGLYSINISHNECEISNLCVLEDYRHNGIGRKLLEHAFSKAAESGCKTIKISIVEENVRLKKWYESYGFKPQYTKKYDFFAFTCGYMKKELQ